MTGLDVPRTLLVTNDFPPRVGGVQQYLWNLARNFPPDRLAVLAPSWPRWRDHDAGQPFPVLRWPAAFLWPTRDVFERVRSLVREHRAEVVLFGHGMPLSLVGPALASRGIPYVVLTHGVEVWAAQVPGFSSALRLGLSRARAVTALSHFTARFLRPLVPPEIPLTVLHAAVDPDRFSPTAKGSPIWDRFHLDGRPVVLCVSRLVPRKGQDVLAAGMSLVHRMVPDAVLLVVGDGPSRGAVEAAARTAPAGSVVLAGEVPDAELPAYYSACDLFAMPCRSRWAGLEVEGFGIVFLEAAASGKAVVAGRSGGAAEAVVDGETGLLVEGREPKAVALAVTRLLLDEGLRARMGTAGRAHVERSHTWPMRAAELAGILSRAAG
jgi:phosphatidylinositol alpha-1,6-mannosyltransferase